MNTNGSEPARTESAAASSLPRPPLRLAVIGCALGRPRYHLAIGATPGVQLTALADDDERATKVWAREAGSKVCAYASVSALLAASDTYDALLVASPLAARAAHILAALQTGKPTLAECPFSLSLSDADAVRVMARETGVLLLPALPRRFDAYLLAAAEQIRAGTLGDVTQISCNWSFPLENVDETEDVVTGGWNALVHTLATQTADVCRWWQGNALTVSGDVDLREIGGQSREGGRRAADRALANLIVTHTQGFTTHHLSRSRATQPDERYAFGGSAGNMELVVSAGASAASASAPLLRVARPGQPFPKAGIPVLPLTPERITKGSRNLAADKTPLSPAVLRIQNMLGHFADCVQLGATPQVTPDDAYAALEIVQAGYVSTREGIKISLPLRRPPDIARMLLPPNTPQPALPSLRQE